MAAAFDALEATGTARRPGPDTQWRREKQRVVVASALAQLDQRTGAAGGPAVLVLDEPTTSLVLRYQIEITNPIRRLHDERHVTILLSTHDLETAAARHLVLLRAGQ